MTKISILYPVICGMITIGFTSCKHDYPVPETPAISFKEHVQPIITGNCTAAECHPATGGEFPLVSYNDVIVNGEIKEGKGSDVELIKVIKSTDDDERMPQPPFDALTNDQIKIIELWVEQGAKNN
ncbi:MAG TPA: hypothetical protein PK323_09015 [Bacteroidia bacterium]|nr:hypothetical protein [Bacteroidia bacterium]